MEGYSDGVQKRKECCGQCVNLELCGSKRTAYHTAEKNIMMDILERKEVPRRDQQKGKGLRQGCQYIRHTSILVEGAIERSPRRQEEEPLNTRPLSSLGRHAGCPTLAVFPQPETRYLLVENL